MKRVILGRRRPQHNGDYDEPLLTDELNCLGQEIEGLLAIAKRIVDKGYGQDFSKTHPLVVTNVLQAMLAKAQIDVIEQSAKEFAHLLDDLNEAIANHD